MFSREVPSGLVWMAVFQVLLIVFDVSCHGHSHHNELNKERVQDGAVGSRGQKHFEAEQHDTSFDHEAILGSKDAVEEFDQLPPEEAKARLKELAIKMDKDKDGFVDRLELIDWILRSFKLLTQEEAAERFEDEDKNGDGKVTWDEHVSEAFGSPQKISDSDSEDNDLRNLERVTVLQNPSQSLSSLVDSVRRSRKQLLEEDDRYFKAADANGDGVLDKNEFPKFSHPSEFPEMQETLYEETMKRKDVDKDGYLSLEEFTTEDPDKPLSNEQYIAEKERFEVDYDKNGDRKLDKEETLNWLLPGNDEVAEQEAEHLIANGDADNDGKLSIQEIIDHHELFVGSEATDYGEHLHNTSRFSDEL
ncbi:reticulocalbin-2 isoform X2 [Dermacentor albipictus]|uniref:reticulocalbin-2 isoform X2 n=1 Tax=Dermacentor albipictus TaxID=60249 RepID=UPI0038FD3D5B